MDFFLHVLAEFVAFGVVVWVLYRFAWPFLKRMMDQRQDQIQQQVDESERAAARLREAESRYEAALAEARGEAARIRDDARADSQRIREELKEQAEREAERIRQRGDEQLAAHREQTVRRLQAEIGGLSMRLAERMVVDSLSGPDGEARRSATVDAFLDDLDRMAGPADGARAHGDGADGDGRVRGQVLAGRGPAGDGGGSAPEQSAPLPGGTS